VFEFTSIATIVEASCAEAAASCAEAAGDDFDQRASGVAYALEKNCHTRLEKEATAI
jgi:hypothetical protein